MLLLLLLLLLLLPLLLFLHHILPPEISPTCQRSLVKSLFAMLQAKEFQWRFKKSGKCSPCHNSRLKKAG
jgi:hypothetical protein